MSLHRTLVIASNNQHKVAEISAVLGSTWTVLSAQQVAPGISWDECGTSFLENARIKANTLRKFTAHCVLADDSGLCVDALGGAPGVWSSSYGGLEGDHKANNRRLVSELQNVAAGERQASFICQLVFLDETRREMTAVGRCDGSILLEPAGSQGFGYDPLFFVTELGKAMAELSPTEKNEVSHRGRALRELAGLLESSGM